MVVTSINDPLKRQSLLIIVLGAENLERMRRGDPIVLAAPSSGGIVFSKVEFPNNCGILISYEEEDAPLYDLVRRGDAIAIARYLERGSISVVRNQAMDPQPIQSGFEPLPLDEP